MFCDLIKVKTTDSGTMYPKDRKAHEYIQIPEERMRNRQVGACLWCPVTGNWVQMESQEPLGFSCCEVDGTL